jgi:hypothetical protein
MKRHCFLLVCASLACGVLQSPCQAASSSPVSHERLLKACANLRNAAALSEGGVATSVAEESKKAEKMSDADLTKEIFSLADRIIKSCPTAPRASKPDIFAYSADARLAIIDNRTEPFDGHRRFIIGQPQKAQKYIVEAVQDIKKALQK